MKTQYIIEDVIIKDWMHSFVKIAHTKEEADAYVLHAGEEINVIAVSTEKDKKDYFVRAVAGLDSELSPENLHCDGEISQAQAMVRYRDIVSRLRRMERESQMDLEPLLHEGLMWNIQSNKQF